MSPKSTQTHKKEKEIQLNFMICCVLFTLIHICFLVCVWAFQLVHCYPFHPTTPMQGTFNKSLMTKRQLIGLSLITNDFLHPLIHSTFLFAVAS